MKKFILSSGFLFLFLLTPVIRAQNTETDAGNFKPLRIAVMDFTTTDVEGQKRFLDHTNKPIEIPEQSTLKAGDRLFVSRRTQGFVRMIDARDTSMTNSANRYSQMQDNERDYQKTREIYDTVIKGETRPIVIGAEYLSAYLGKHSDVFSCMDSKQIETTMGQLESSADFPKDFMLRLAEKTGATHLIFGTVSDMRSKETVFKGYDIETKTVVYQLDIIIKVVDLNRQGTVYSNVYTGTYREQKPVTGVNIDNNKFQTLMNGALQQAAEDIYEAAKPGKDNKIPPVVLSRKIKINVKGGMFFNEKNAEIYIDGLLAGNGNSEFHILDGKHTIEVKAKDYKPKKMDLLADSDKTITVTLEK